LTDARNTQQEEFETEGPQQVCGSHAKKSPLELLGHIFAIIQKFMGDCPHFGDMTAAILHYPDS
jgi:serine phosphatase RsbU (regulator of sigma subunit)